MNRILTLLRSPGAMLVALVAALAAQAEHTAQVFSMVVQAQGIFATLHAYAFACAVEIAVLLFVLAGHRRISYGFALATFATNLSYYAMHDVPLLSLAGAPAWLMSLLLPAAIVGYSHTIAETPEYKPAMPAERPQDARKRIVKSDSASFTVSEETAGAGGHGEAMEAPTEPAETAGETSTPRLAPSQRRAHIREQELFDAAQVVAQFGVSLRTAQQDIAQVRKATTHANGAARHE